MKNKNVKLILTYGLTIFAILFLPNQYFSQKDSELEKEKVIRKYFEYSLNNDSEELDKLVVSSSILVDIIQSKQMSLNKSQNEGQERYKKEFIKSAELIRELYTKQFSTHIKKSFSKIKRIDWFLNQEKSFSRVFYQEKGIVCSSGRIYYQDFYFVGDENQEWQICEIGVPKFTGYLRNAVCEK